MEWLVRQLNARFSERSWKVVPAENYQPQSGRDVYRFFELFDLPNLPGITALMEAAGRGELTVTPPFKPYLEEKMWFALFWLQPLRDFWRRELGDKYFRQLQRMIPYTWILDPTPLPQHAVIPRLEIHDWREAARFSQKERDLLLKVSGFSPLGWGSRGVALGADLPHAEWQQRIADALVRFEHEPTIMQRFHKGRLFDHPYWDAETGELKTMRGRVRLLSLLLRRVGRGDVAWGACDHLSGRQEAAPRDARRDSGPEPVCGCGLTRKGRVRGGTALELASRLSSAESRRDA